MHQNMGQPMVPGHKASSTLMCSAPWGQPLGAGPAVHPQGQAEVQFTLA